MCGKLLAMISVALKAAVMVMVLLRWVVLLAVIPVAVQAAVIVLLRIAMGGADGNGLGGLALQAAMIVLLFRHNPQASRLNCPRLV